VGGGLLVVRSLGRLRRGSDADGSPDRRYLVLAGFFAVFLLYSSGFVPAVTGEFQYNEALVVEEHLEDPTLIADSASSTLLARDVAGARFLADHREITYPVLTDFTGVFVWSYGEVPRQDRWPPVESATREPLPLRSPESIPAESYVFFRPVNTERGILVANVGSAKYSGEDNHVDSAPYIHAVGSRKALVYSNGGARIYA
jgi:uncharacterized membrane protein